MPSSPQRQRDYRSSPLRQGGPPAGGGWNGMYGGMPPNQHHPFHAMGMKHEYDTSPSRFGAAAAGGGGGPSPPGSGPNPQYGGGPQAFHPAMAQGGSGSAAAAAAAAAAMGQFGQFPFYGGFPGPHPSNGGYFPPTSHGHHPDLGLNRSLSTGSVGGGSGTGGGGTKGGKGGGKYPSASPTRSKQGYSSSNNNSPNDAPSQSSSYKNKSNASTPTNSKGGGAEGAIKETSSIDSKSPDKSTSLENKFSPSPDTAESKINVGTMSGFDYGDEDDMASGVNPMRSDFHFFAMDKKDAFIEEIKSEKSKPNQEDGKNDESKEKEGQEGKEEEEEHTPFAIMTSLNERLLKLWEETPARSKAMFMQREESDRYRFMSEDEIASRHCATLTSRTSGAARKNANANSTEISLNTSMKEGEETEETEETEKTKDSNEKSSGISGQKRVSLQTAPSTDNKNGEDNVTSEFESPTKKKKEDKDESVAKEEKQEDKDNEVAKNQTDEQMQDVTEPTDEQTKNTKMEDDKEVKVDEEKEDDKEEKAKTESDDLSKGDEKIKEKSNAQTKDNGEEGNNVDAIKTDVEPKDKS